MGSGTSKNKPPILIRAADGNKANSDTKKPPQQDTSGDRNETDSDNKKPAQQDTSGDRNQTNGDNKKTTQQDTSGDSPNLSVVPPPENPTPAAIDMKTPKEGSQSENNRVPSPTKDTPTELPPAKETTISTEPSVSSTTPIADKVKTGTHEKTDILRQCISFLTTATNTGGNTVKHNAGDNRPNDEKTADKRDAFRPEFRRSLDELYTTTDNYTDDTALRNLHNICLMSDMYTDNEPANELLELIYPELFVKIWKAVYHKDIYKSKERHRDFIVFNLLKQATINFTHVNERLCASMGSEKYGIISLMVEEFKHPLMAMNILKDGVKQALWDSPRETLKKMVNILANIVRMNIDSKPVFRQANVVQHLEELLNCRFLLMRAKALFTLVYLINEDENEALNTGDDNIKFVLKVLGKCLDEKGHYSKHYTFSAAVVMDGIVYLAANDSNKVKLVEHGLLPKLISMMTSHSLAEKRTASRAIWKLAFHEDNKKTLKENQKLITVLNELLNNETDQHINKACKTVLWMLDVEDGSKDSRPKTAKMQRLKSANTDRTDTQTAVDVVEAKDPDLDVVSLSGNDLDDNPPHVMISYQWGVQTQMIKIKELLKAAGFNVWMDIDNMGGSTLESMAAAVEQSAVVLICFTEKYKLSASCRTEAEYTYKLQKPIIPLRLQEEYDPDGWLGIMIGTKLYVDFSMSDVLEENLKKLKQLIGDRGRACEENQSTLKSTSGPDKDKLNSTGAHQKNLSRTTRRNTVPKVTDFTDAKTVSSWTNDQVTSWLATHGLGDLKNRFEGYNGQRLLGLKTISTDAPDFFFTEIKKDLGFKNLLDIVKFKQALDEII